MWKNALLVLFIFLFSPLSFSLSSETSNLSQWLTYNRYLNHTSWDGISFSVIGGLNKANFTTAVPFQSSPAVANGFVYVGDVIGGVNQVNASNVSQFIARFTTGASVYSPSAVVNGYVYVGATSGSFYQLNATNVSGTAGNPLSYISRFTTGASIYHGAVVSNGSVYVGSNDQYLYQLNASNVSVEIARFHLNGLLGSTPSIAGNYLYAGDSVGTVYQLNLSNISQQISNFTVEENSISGSSPVISNDYLYIGISNVLYQLNASNLSANNNPIATFATGNSIYATAAISNGYVYIGSYDANIYQLNASNISGSSDTPSSYYAAFGASDSFSSTTIANGYLYAGNSNNYLYQINASNISKPLIASFVANGPIQSGIAAANGYIYFGSNDHYFYQLNASNVSLINSYINATFVSPTPENNSIVSTNSITINVSSSSFPSGHYTFTDLNNSLVLWLTMDDFSTTPIDRSSYSRTISNAGVFQTSLGYWGKGINITGTHITLDRPIQDNFTICAWINTVSAGYEDYHWRSAPIFESESANPADDFGFGLGGNGNLIFGHGDLDSNQDYTIVGSTVINDSQWHFVCATRNKQTAEMSVFVDSNLDGTGTESSASLDSNPTAMIGFGTDGANQFNGLMDDLIVFNRALSNSEISHLYNSTPYEITFSNLSEGEYNLTSYVVNLHGEVGQTETRFFTIAFPSIASPSPTDSSSSYKLKNIFLNLSSSSGFTSITLSDINGPLADARVVLDGELLGFTNNSGSLKIPLCGKRVRLYISKENYNQFDETVDLPACNVLKITSTIFCAQNEIDLLVSSLDKPLPNVTVSSDFDSIQTDNYGIAKFIVTENTTYVFHAYKNNYVAAYVSVTYSCQNTNPTINPINDLNEEISSPSTPINPNNNSSIDVSKVPLTDGNSTSEGNVCVFFISFIFLVLSGNMLTKN